MSEVKRNLVSRADQFKVMNWIAANLPALKQDNFTYEDANKRLLEQTKIKLTLDQFKRLNRDTGLGWTGSKKSRGKSLTKQFDRPRYLATVVKSLVVAIQRLANELEVQDKIFEGLPPIDLGLLAKLEAGISLSEILPSLRKVQDQKGDEPQ